ncbi:lytic transglycosylase domain-containing protein [Nocardia sp. NBC_00416]|uniref:lytic transglycosylase domain-containing protein n=1 Tax=Nocardia sp. NBC_00416 TaxID=2975991 RepID=UPI002E215D87
MSALVMAGLVAGGSAAHTTLSSTPPEAPGAQLAANAGRLGDLGVTTEAALPQTLGMLPVEPTSPRKLRALSPAGASPFGRPFPPQSINLPSTGGALGIPEIVLAAYRNAELALQSSTPGCGVTWNLLAGIGRIESGHASNGRTDAAGTTNPPIFGPALDGSLPGNEVIRTSEGGYVRAMGPMQFLPGTWSHYAADGNGDGRADPHNVFDAALGAGKYLCSGGSNLRDPQQELRAVLRYNNSMSYAATVLSWSAAYRTGGRPAPVPVSPGLVPPGSLPTGFPPGPTDLLAAQTEVPPPPPSFALQTPRPAPMIRIPGLPPIPCGLLCPPAPGSPKVGEALPESVPAPERPGEPGAPTGSAPGAPGTRAPEAPAPAESAPSAPTPAEPENQAPPAAPAPAPAAPPSITLPGGLVVPLPIAIVAAPTGAAPGPADVPAPPPAPAPAAPATPAAPAPPA